VLSPDQIRLLDTIRGRWEEYRKTSNSAYVQMYLTRIADENINRGTDEFGTDIINGLTPRLERGSLGLKVPSAEACPPVRTERSVSNLDGYKEVGQVVLALH
jgi:hypothetical protein